MSQLKIAARIVNLVLAFGIAFATLPAQAAIPQTLNYQGQLASAAGVPVNGTVNITFSLYDVATNGAVLWMETKSVAVSNGLYSIILGVDTPLDSGMFGSPRYLGVSVGTDPEMTPRIALSSSATALRASLADSAATADALAPTAIVAGSQITGTLSNVTISGATLVNSQISDTATVCDAAHAGALRWAAATRSFEGCTGSAWTTIIQEPLIRIATVDTPVPTGASSSIRIGADGLPMIAYYDATSGGLKVAKCTNAACNGASTITTVDTVWGDTLSSAIGADGLPVIAYFDFTNRDLKVAHCGNAACSSGNTLTAVDTGGYVGPFPSISIGADGLPVIAYFDSTNGDLKVAKCGNAACSAGNTLTAVDTAGSVGFYTSIAIGADGLPVISYWDSSYLDLKVAHCGDAACSAGNTLTSVDTVGDVGMYSSITIGTDGLPVISYYDATNGNLNVAHCSNAACSASNTITAVDTTGNVGAYTSIAIGTDGLPVIAYQDATNIDLKVAHCGNAACTVSWPVVTLFTSLDIGNNGYGVSITIGTDGLPAISYYGTYSVSSLKVAHCGRTTCWQYN